MAMDGFFIGRLSASRIELVREADGKWRIVHRQNYMLDGQPEGPALLGRLNDGPQRHMKFTMAIPLGDIMPGEFQTPEAVREMSLALEAAGIDACYVTDHPGARCRVAAAGDGARCARSLRRLRLCRGGDHAAADAYQHRGHGLPQPVPDRQIGGNACKCYRVGG